MIDILLVDDQKILFEGLRKIFEPAPDIAICATCALAELAEEACLRYRPDLVLMDICMESRTSGIRICRRLKERFPAIRVVMVALVLEHRADARIGACLDEGEKAQAALGAEDGLVGAAQRAGPHVRHACVEAALAVEEAVVAVQHKARIGVPRIGLLQNVDDLGFLFHFGICVLFHGSCGILLYFGGSSGDGGCSEQGQASREDARPLGHLAHV